MRLSDLKHDETLRSSVHYGTSELPFARFDDEPGKYKSQCIDWHWHYEIEFAFVTQNTVSCFIGAKEITLLPGDGIFLNSGIIHRFESADNGAMTTVIFAPEFMSSKSNATYHRYITPVLQSGLEYSVFRGDDPKYTNVLSAGKVLCGYGIREDNALSLQIAALSLWRELCLLLMPKLATVGRIKNSLSKSRLQLMLSYISQHYSEQIHLEDIAASAKISKSETLRCFKDTLKTTPVHFLTEYRLSMAMHLLQTTPDTVISIAFACGFDDAGYFCKVFRRRYGVSPNQSRQSS